MKTSPEKMSSPEKEVTSKVILEFMRHGKKEKDPTKPNEELLLTPEGKKGAVEKGKILKPQPEVAVAIGSPRKRTQETTGHVMLANEETINPNASLKEMEAVIANAGVFGKKIIADKRLDFNENGPIGKELTEADEKGKYLSYLIEQSDQRALETRDKESFTYLRLAGNVAEIIDKYVKIGNNFNKIVSENDKYQKFGNQLERYLGTHLGVVESFMAKALEKTEGLKKRDEFIKSLGAGFKETQGIRVEIINKGESQEISITYELGDKEEVININQELIADIIKDREEFDKKFE